MTDEIIDLINSETVDNATKILLIIIISIGGYFFKRKITPLSEQVKTSNGYTLAKYTEDINSTVSKMDGKLEIMITSIEGNRDNIHRLEQDNLERHYRLEQRIREAEVLAEQLSRRLDAFLVSFNRKSQ